MRVYRLRYLVQIAFLLLIFYGAYLGLRFKNFLPTWSCPNSVDYSPACYLLPLQRFQASLTPDIKCGMPFPGFFIIEGWTAYLKFFLSLVIFIVIFNKLWCGWICPFGAFQDFLTFVRKKLKGKGLNFTGKTKHNLRPVKYIALFSMLITPLLFTFGLEMDWPLFCKICPVKSLLSLSYGNTGNLTVGFPPGMLASTLTCIIAGFILAAVIFRERFFCVLCPVSALFNIFNKFSFLQLKKKPNSCISCGKCWRACPMDINTVYLEKKENNVLREDCILCLKCIEACPKDKVLSIAYLKKTIFAASEKCSKKAAENKKNKND